MIRTALVINVLIAIIAAIGIVAPEISFLAAIALIICMSAIGIQDPQKLFFLFFGVKFTLDILWWVSPTEDKFFLRITDLAFLPVAVCTVMGFIRAQRMNYVVTGLFFLFAIWCTVNQFALADRVDVSIPIKLAGSFLGLTLGQCFLSKRVSLLLIFRLLFLSTLIPTLAGLIQIMADRFADMEIFFVTGGDRSRSMASIRGVRYSGLYYDAGTSGVCALVTVVSSIGVLHSSRLRLGRQLVYFAAISSAIFLMIGGATRSTLAVSFFVITVFGVFNFRKFLVLLPLLAIPVGFSWDKVDAVLNRSNTEMEMADLDLSQGLDPTNLLDNDKYGRLFTGRMGIWQDIYHFHLSRPAVQRFFGTGINTGAHSTYFFLLLYLGSLGLIYYLVIHVVLLTNLFRIQRKNRLRIIAIGCLLAFLALGMSLDTVKYTSIQWICYLIVGGAINSDQDRSAPPPVPHARIA